MTQESKEKSMNILHKVDLDTFTVRDMARTVNANTDVLDELTKGMSGSIDTLISEVEEVSSQLEHNEEKISILNKEKIVLSPIMYGCIGDGIADDTLNFQLCINEAITKGAEINGLGKTYLISDVQQIPTKYAESEYGLYIEGSLRLYNCHFILKDNCVAKTSILSIANPTGTSVVLDNIHINGNGHNQYTTVSSQDGGLHGIRVSYLSIGPNVGGFELLNSTITDCYSDCVVGRSCNFDFFHIRNCEISLGGRNGLTEDAYNSVVEDCKFINNGWRTAPKSGYHLEPDSSWNMNNKIIRNCIFKNNQGDDFKIHFNSYAYNLNNLTLDGCIMDNWGMALYSQVESYTNNINIYNCKINDFSIGYASNRTTNHNIKNITIRDSHIAYSKIRTSDITPIKTSIKCYNTKFSSTMYYYSDFDTILFDGCKFYRDIFENIDATRNNILYFDYDGETISNIVNSFSIINSEIENINRGVSIGRNTRTFNNFIISNNRVSTGHAFLLGSAKIKNVNVSNNVFRFLGDNPGTAGKIRFSDSHVNYAIFANNMWYMSERSSYGGNNITNSVKVNEMYDMVDDLFA